jgi:hypothetical protein
MRRPPRLLAASALLAAGCLGAALTGCGAAGRPDAASNAASASPSSAASPTPAPSEPAGPATTVVTPQTLVGRAKATEKNTLDLYESAFRGFTSQGKKASGAYGAIAQRDVAMFIAFDGDNPDAEEMLDVAAQTWFKGTALHKIAPGPLGGAARCASAVRGRTRLTQCVWASRTTFGLAYFFFVDQATAEKQFLQARAQIEVPA